LWDLTPREYLIVVPLVAGILLLGLYPKPVLDRINPSTARSCVLVRDLQGGPSIEGPPAAGQRLSRLECAVGSVGSLPVPSPSPSGIVQMGAGP
jgi:hypothetical protein